jgi:2Fe-2S ferredoxin
VFIDPAWLGRLPAPAAAEQDLLECTAVPRQENSRLSCQVKLTPELEGLVVVLPERQT